MAKSVDRGMTGLLREMQYLEDHEIRMGVLAGSVDSDSLGQKAGDVRSEDRKLAQSGQQEELTQIEVFTIHELGLGITQRNVISFVMDKHRPEIQKMEERVMNLVFEGKMTGEDALGFMGEFIVGKYQQRIFDRIDPPLAEETIAAKTRKDGKKADIPLVLYSQYNRSFRWNIVKSKGVNRAA